MALPQNIGWLKTAILYAFPILSGIGTVTPKSGKPLQRNAVPDYAASFILSFTMLASLATNSPLVGLPFSGLTVLPK